MPGRTELYTGAHSLAFMLNSRRDGWTAKFGFNP
jgi:hypothetical protein